MEVKYIREPAEEVIKAGRSSKMNSQKFETPTYPQCGKPLEVVYENECWTLLLMMELDHTEASLLI